MNILASFSGGRTSAFMTKWLIDNHPDDNIKIVFSNTGQEHPKTYKFIENFSDYFQVPITWIEGVFPQDREIKSSWKVVTPDAACRDIRLFEELIGRYGMPNVQASTCTREFKTRTIKRFTDAHFGKKNYRMAIGIRSDEIDRVNPNYEKMGFYYPLAFNGTTKETVNQFWEGMPFNLEIPKHLGNCVWCFKKSFNVLRKVYEDGPHWFDGPKYLEEKWPLHHLESQPYRFGEPASIFREKNTTVEMISRFQELIKKDQESSYENSCAESCDVFGEENLDLFDLILE